MLNTPRYSMVWIQMHSVSSCGFTIHFNLFMFAALHSQEKKPLVPQPMQMDASLADQAAVVASAILGDAADQDMVKAHTKVGIGQHV